MKKLCITTEFYAEVPDDTGADEIENIVLALDVDTMRIETLAADAGSPPYAPILGASIMGFQTVDVEQADEPEET